MIGRTKRTVALALGLAMAVVACSDNGAPDALGSTDDSVSVSGGVEATAVGRDEPGLGSDPTGPTTTRVGSEAAGQASTTSVAVPASSETVETTSTTSTPTTTTAAETTTTIPTAEKALATVQAYVGGTPGVADPVNGTVGIGWVNQEGGTPSFSDATTGLAAAVAYVNQQLGGLGGKVLELHTCAVQRVADGARCAQQMRDDPAVSVVIIGAVTLGNDGLLDGLEGVKPVVLANPLTTADYLAGDGVAYSPGSPGIVAGLARFAAEGLPTGVPAKIAVVYPFGLAGEAAFQLLAKPVFDRAGIPVVPVPVLEGADPSAFAAVIQTAGAADATAFVPILGVRGCIGVDQALRDLASTASVLVTDACIGTAMTNWVTSKGGSGLLPEGWYVGGSGFRFGVGPDPTQAAYLSVMDDYVRSNTLPPVDITGFAASSFGALATVVKLMNTIAPEARTPEALRAATRSFPGPMWGVVGPMQCGFNAFYPSLCGTQMGVQRYTGGAFVPTADGYTGGSIDLTALVTPPA